MIDYNDNSDPDAPIVARVDEVTPLPWPCAKCGEGNETLLDMTGGYNQEYVEDCAVCCRPNLLGIHVEPGTMIVTISNELE